MSNIKIKTAGMSDLPRIAVCHRKAFPRTLSSAMGLAYLEKMLEWYLMDDRAFIALIESDGNCLGYFGGLKVLGDARLGSASSMVQHSYNAALRSLLVRPWLLVHPEFLSKYKFALRNTARKLGRMFNTRKDQDSVRTSPSEPYAGLVVIGVDPAMQGKGYGSLLLKEFEDQSRAMGVRKLSLTVKSDNAQAIGSYRKNGWQITSVNGNATIMEKHLG